MSSNVQHDMQVLQEIHEHFDHLEARLSALEGLDVRVQALEKMLQVSESNGRLAEMSVATATEALEMAEVRFFFGVDDLSETNELESDPASESSTADSQKSKSTYDPQPTPDSSDKLRRRITIPVVDHVDEKVLDVQTQEYYRFGESTWDLFLFIGTGALGPLGSLQTFLLAVVSMSMQIVFTGIAWYNFLTPEVDEDTVRDAFRWRRSAGHALTQYDPLSKSSLAERVCALDKSLPASGIQVTLYENIIRYMKPGAEGLESFFTGERLCLVALLCWYLMVAKEVNHGLALHRGIMATPLGPTKINSRENPFTLVMHYRLISVSVRRKIASAILLAYRLLAAAALIYVGTFFLVYTIDVTELILNAVALAIILDIDDLLFDALATTPGRHLVNQMDPLPMKSWPRVRGADVKSMSMLVLIPLVTMIVYLNMLAPMVATLDSAKDAMCGGNLQFVWTTDQRNVILLSPTQGDGWKDGGYELQSKAVDEAEVLSVSDANSGTSWGVWLGSVDALTETSILPLEQSVDVFNPRCADLGDTEPLRNYLREFLGNESLMGCDDARPYCGLMDGSKGKGFAARMLCSDTCGCNDPAGEVMQIAGCPYGLGRACWSSSGFLESLESYTCEEKSAAELRSDERWSRWVESIRAIGEATDTETEGKEEALLTAQAMWDHGCAFGDHLTETGVTWGSCFSWRFDWGLKTVEAFCPRTCGCDSDNLDSGCPRPLGLDCESLAEECIFASGSYHCPDNTPHFEGTVEVDVDDPETFEESSHLVTEALRRTLANLTGHSVLPNHVLISGSSRRLALARRLAKKDFDYVVFVLSEANETSAKNALAAATPPDENAVFIRSLLEVGVPAEGAGLSINVKGVVSSKTPPSSPTPVTSITSVSTTATSLPDSNDTDAAGDPSTTTSTTSTSHTGSNDTSFAPSGDRADRPDADVSGPRV